MLMPAYNVTVMLKGKNQGIWRILNEVTYYITLNIAGLVKKRMVILQIISHQRSHMKIP